MYSQRSLGENTTGDEPLRIWDVTKIGEFDMDSWRKIFLNLSDYDLANVALVCHDFRTMAQKIIENRYKTDTADFCMTFSETKWKPVICRFRSVILKVTVIGPCGKHSIRQADFSYFENFMSETIRDLCFYQTDSIKLKNIVIRKKFVKLERLTLIQCNMNYQCPLATRMSHWYPGLKSLRISHCSMRRSKFLEQPLPLMEDASLTIPGSNVDFFLIFIIKNRQLKYLCVDLYNVPLGLNMSCLPIVNEILPNLESIVWSCCNLTLLPNFRNTFANVKKLGFEFKSMGTYKNELLRIVKYFPSINEILLLQLSQNLMTNDDLIDLLTECSCTLRNMTFTSRGTEKNVTFSSDLHRRVRDATSNRPDIQILIEYNGPFNRNNYLITKEFIKENGKLIVLSATQRDV